MSDSSSSLLLSNSIPRNGEVFAQAASSSSAQDGRAEAEVDRLVIIEKCRMLKQVRNTSGFPCVCDTVKQQLRDAKQKAAPPPKLSERGDHEDILEGLEREYAAAMAKLQSAHEREMLLSSRVGDLQTKLQVCFRQLMLPLAHFLVAHRQPRNSALRPVSEKAS